MILEPGGTYDPMDMIRDFLGREPQKDAFYQDIGLDTTKV
jgi:metallopeptidase MepB